MRRYYLKICCDLALFRHFYHLSRDESLDLPSWEWNSLLEEVDRIKSKDYMQMVYAVSSGFNGGDSAQAYMQNLIDQQSKGFESPEKAITDLEDVMPGLDSLIPKLGSK